MIVLDVSESICPEQTGLLPPGTGTVGGELTVMFVVPALPIHPATEVAITEYVPEFTIATEVMTGFCEAEVKPLGPLQL